MFRRLEAALGPVTPEGLLGLDDPTMRRCGFTRQKAGLCPGPGRRRRRRVGVAGRTLPVCPIEDAVSALTALRGVGEWTAENYLIWALGRRESSRPTTWRCASAGRLCGGGAPPSPRFHEGSGRRVVARARTAAAFLVWHYYLAVRRRA